MLSYEFFRRINNWFDLEKATIEEKSALCIQRVIKNEKLIRKISTNASLISLAQVQRILISIRDLVHRKIDSIIK